MTDRITGLAGVLLMTTPERYPAMRAFYIDTLGLTPRSDRPARVSFDVAPPADVRLTIAIHDALEGPASEPDRVMLNLAVDDIDATAARLRAAGAAFTRNPEREAFGGRVATLRDPDGNTLQLLEQPK